MEVYVPEMLDDRGWEDKVKGMLKAELKRQGVTYQQLVEKLAKIGVIDTEPNIRNKLARGKFTAVFMFQCLEAIGTNTLRLSDL
jgi:microsomal dipeptidase-like Zn-dependent dipeptidase